jgi:hypothetical protein
MWDGLQTSLTIPACGDEVLILYYVALCCLAPVADGHGANKEDYVTFSCDEHLGSSRLTHNFIARCLRERSSIAHSHLAAPPFSSTQPVCS